MLLQGEQKASQHPIGVLHVALLLGHQQACVHSAFVQVVSYPFSRL